MKLASAAALLLIVCVSASRPQIFVTRDSKCYMLMQTMAQDNCAPGCTIKLLTNGVCNKECDVAECTWDGNSCLTYECRFKVLLSTLETMCATLSAIIQSATGMEETANQKISVGWMPEGVCRR